MNPPVIDGNVESEKLEEDKKEGPMYHCELFDTEVIHKIAQAFLPGLASACVDNTTGGIFRSPGSVAVEIRKEMVDYLTQRSENFVAESVVLEGGPDTEVSDHPYDIIADFVDDFASSKRNFFSRVSGWVLSERREERIDDFVQELELNGFWLLQRREAVAQSLVKNVDFKNTYHCNMKFKTPEELTEHVAQCGFRTVNCRNEGCNTIFTAAHMENHDSTCDFKILPCEQKCSDEIMRRDMDRHCITVCPMKLVNCPFYAVGCQATVPRCMVEEHNTENLHHHTLCILQGIYKEAPAEDLEERLEQLEKSANPGQLSGAARNVRSLTNVVKRIDAKLAPLVIKTKPKEEEEEEESADSPAKKELTESPSKKEEKTESPTKDRKSTESPSKKEEIMESPTKDRKSTDSSTKERKSTESLPKERKSTESPTKSEENMESPTKDRKSTESPTNKEESANSPAKSEEPIDSPVKKEESSESPTKKEKHKESPIANEN
ncbi:hypothetical protein LguiB_030698 [Lonicera macranthoides]